MTLEHYNARHKWRETAQTAQRMGEHAVESDASARSIARLENDSNRHVRRKQVTAISRAGHRLGLRSVVSVPLPSDNTMHASVG
jgi:hypothetical protein